MKKKLVVLIVLAMISCKKNQSITHEITNFDKQISDTISPIKGENYGARFIYVKGYVDDSIYVSFGGNSYKSFLSKKIDTSFSTDYYGNQKAIFIFNPYKGRKGNLKITFKI